MPCEQGIGNVVDYRPRVDALSQVADLTGYPKIADAPPDRAACIPSPVPPDDPPMRPPRLPGTAPLRIASFGFRHLPPRAGCAGADKFVLELLPRLAARGHEVVAYNRIAFNEQAPPPDSYRGVKRRTIRTFRASGLEALWHAARVTFDIIRHNRADVVHIQNGGNSPFGAILRLFGKRTVLTEDGKEWERGKWSPLARSYLRAMTWLSARVHSEVVFDNVFARAEVEAQAGRRFALIHYGAEVDYQPDADAEAAVLARFGLVSGDYFLFVGRFIPDKGLHHLVAAFEQLETNKKLVLVGGAPAGSDYAAAICATADPRLVLPGFLYGAETHALMRHCVAYVQPSDLEGLSPVILEAAFLGTPVICSDIAMNRYALGEHGIYFAAGEADDLRDRLAAALAAPDALRVRAAAQQGHVADTYSWERVTDEYVRVFTAKGRER
jgi:glycosyltransferase involved in cell wall biosynthesis